MNATTTKPKEAKQVKPDRKSPEYKSWCLSEDRLASLKKEMDKYIAQVKARVPDATYRIDLEDNNVYFNGGPEKQISTTLIQEDAQILSLFRNRRLYSTIGYTEKPEHKLERLMSDPEKFDKLMEALGEVE